MKRGSPKPQFAHWAQRGKTTPSRHWPATSNHDARWNEISWPEAFPRNSIGATTAVARIAIKSKAIRSVCRAESGPETAVGAWGLALFRTESEDIAMRARFTPKI